MVEVSDVRTVPLFLLQDPPGRERGAGRPGDRCTWSRAGQKPPRWRLPSLKRTGHQWPERKNAHEATRQRTARIRRPSNRGVSGEQGQPVGLVQQIADGEGSHFSRRAMAVLPSGPVVRRCRKARDQDRQWRSPPPASSGDLPGTAGGDRSSNFFPTSLSRTKRLRTRTPLF